MSVLKRRIEDSSSGPTTFIAATTKIVGTISGDGSYIFGGRVEGDCDVKGAVTLSESGHWVGTLKAGDVIVAGTIEGDVIANGKVEISGTAKVIGSIAGKSIAVAEGAVIEGEIKVMNGAEPLMFEEKRQA